MRDRASRIVLAQAILSTAAIVIVYLTLLRPEGEGPRVEVDLPGPEVGRQELARPPAGRQPTPPPRPGSGADAGTPPAGAAGEPGVSLTTGVDRAQLEPEGPGTPSLDQYGGTLGRIAARIAAAPD